MMTELSCLACIMGGRGDREVSWEEGQLQGEEGEGGQGEGTGEGEDQGEDQWVVVWGEGGEREGGEREGREEGGEEEGGEEER